jgi:hypothetical protein
MMLFVVRAEAKLSTTVEGVELAFVAIVPADSSFAKQAGVLGYDVANVTVAVDTLDPVVTRIFLSSPITAEHPVLQVGEFPPVVR